VFGRILRKPGSSSETLAGHHDKRVLGRWFGEVEGEPVALDFRPDGELLYVVKTDGQLSAIQMTWRIEGDVLVTDQPSHPREERSRLDLDDARLVVTFDGRATEFVR
jgi:DNA-binding beta-propeller fold protein YncE